MLGSDFGHCLNIAVNQRWNCAQEWPRSYGRSVKISIFIRVQLEGCILINVLTLTTTGGMSMITIDFTYQTVTPESAEHGDFDSHGFIEPGMWKYDVDNYDRNIWKQGDLAGLIDFAQSLGIAKHPDADWAYSIDGYTDYETGENTIYAMHIDGCTEASKQRIFALL
jgi:hypothetical protein